jgi:hypothetical protein
VRAYSFFVVSALAAALAFGASSKRLEPEPSESQMESSFNQFLSKLATGAYSEIQFTAFKKHSCKPSTATTGHYYCSFTYSTDMPADGSSILPSHGTISGMFFADDDGQLRFEMVIG